MVMTAVRCSLEDKAYSLIPAPTPAYIRQGVSEGALIKARFRQSPQPRDVIGVLNHPWDLRPKTGVVLEHTFHF